MPKPENRDLDTIIESLMDFDENQLAAKRDIAKKAYQISIARPRVTNNASFAKRDGLAKYKGYREPRERSAGKLRDSTSRDRDYHRSNSGRISKDRLYDKTKKFPSGRDHQG